jgi:hypothetical protein
MVTPLVGEFSEWLAVMKTASNPAAKNSLDRAFMPELYAGFRERQWKFLLAAPPIPARIRPCFHTL